MAEEPFDLGELTSRINDLKKQEETQKADAIQQRLLTLPNRKITFPNAQQLDLIGTFLVRLDTTLHLKPGGFDAIHGYSLAVKPIEEQNLCDTGVIAVARLSGRGQPVPVGQLTYEVVQQLDDKTLGRMTFCDLHPHFFEEHAKTARPQRLTFPLDTQMLGPGACKTFGIPYDLKLH